MSTDKSGIYTIINTVNGKVYVGSTKDFERRWGSHKRELTNDIHGNSYLQRSWNKYGESAFEFMICEYVDDPEQLIDCEQYWLDFHRMYIGVYNIQLVIDRSALSDETKVKMSVAKKGKKRDPFTEEHKHKTSQSLMGHSVSEESKRKKMYTIFRLLGLGDGSYPALKHKKTGEIIPTGNDLVALCLERKLSVTQMAKMVCRMCYTCEGWQLKDDPLLHKLSRPYPSFIHKGTGEIVPAGRGLATLCRKLGVPYTGEHGCARRGWVSLWLETRWGNRKRVNFPTCVLGGLWYNYVK